MNINNSEKVDLLKLNRLHSPSSSTTENKSTNGLSVKTISTSLSSVNRRRSSRILLNSKVKHDTSSSTHSNMIVNETKCTTNSTPKAINNTNNMLLTFDSKTRRGTLQKLSPPAITIMNTTITTTSELFKEPDNTNNNNKNKNNQIPFFMTLSGKKPSKKSNRKLKFDLSDDHMHNNNPSSHKIMIFPGQAKDSHDISGHGEFIDSIHKSLPPKRLRYLYMNSALNIKNDPTFKSPLNSPKLLPSHINRIDDQNHRYFYSSPTPRSPDTTKSQKSPINTRQRKGKNRLLFNFTKKFVIAKRIIKELSQVLHDEKPLDTQVSTSESDPKSSSLHINLNRSREESKLTTYLRNMENSVSGILTLTQIAINNRKNRRHLEESLKKIVNKAYETRNLELHLITLTIQAKIYYCVDDLVQAIFTFKTIKRIAEKYMKITKLLKCYKHIIQCYQDIGNYNIARFYCVKLLQCAWICNSKRYELQAYDYLGMQYYYLEDTEKAQYYHNRMSFCECEPQDSEIRKKGVNYLLEHLRDLGQEARYYSIKSLQEEHDNLDYSLSENRFDLPYQANKLREQEQNHEINIGQVKLSNGSIGNDTRTKIALRNLTYHQHHRRIKPLASSKFDFSLLDGPFSKRHSVMNNTQSCKNQQNGKNIGNMDEGRMFNSKISDRVLISHLSPNRSINTKLSTHDNNDCFIGTIDDMNEIDFLENRLNTKAIDRIKKLLEKFRDNILVIQYKLNHLNKIEMFKINQEILKNNEYVAYEHSKVH